MLVAMTAVTEHFSGWHFFYVPVNHSLDPGRLLLPAWYEFDSVVIGAEFNDLSHSRLAMMDVKIFCR